MPPIAIIKDPSAPSLIAGTNLDALAPLSSDATNYGATDAFGLTRVIPRPYCKFTLVLAANAAGNWVPQQSATAPIICFQHGINDNPVALMLIASGISNTYAVKSVEITNSQYNGGFSMTLDALILGMGIVQERIRRVTCVASPTTESRALNGTNPGYVPRGNVAVTTVSSVNDNDFNLSDRLLSSLLGATEFYLLPMAVNTDCNLNLGVYQAAFTAGIGGDLGGPSTSQTTASMRWRFRDDIKVGPGIQGNTSMPNQIQLSWMDGVLGSIGRITGSAAPTEHVQGATGTGDLLAVDCVLIVDVAFGHTYKKGQIIQGELAQQTDGSFVRASRVAAEDTFVFASEFDARKYDCYRSFV